jgi:glycosyltransferase involved in cell wall biosynthesis
VFSSRVGDVEERLQGVFPSKITERKTKELGEALFEILAFNQRFNGREKIEELSLESITQRLLSVYRNVLKRNGHRRRI